MLIFFVRLGCLVARSAQKCALTVFHAISHQPLQKKGLNARRSKNAFDEKILQTRNLQKNSTSSWENVRSENFFCFLASDRIFKVDVATFPGFWSLHYNVGKLCRWSSGRIIGLTTGRSGFDSGDNFFLNGRKAFFENCTNFERDAKLTPNN